MRIHPCLVQFVWPFPLVSPPALSANWKVAFPACKVWAIAFHGLMTTYHSLPAVRFSLSLQPITFFSLPSASHLPLASSILSQRAPPFLPLLTARLSAKAFPSSRISSPLLPEVNFALPSPSPPVLPCILPPFLSTDCLSSPRATLAFPCSAAVQGLAVQRPLRKQLFTCFMRFIYTASSLCSYWHPLTPSASQSPCLLL